MNLGKLLATGKSIISGRVADRYRKNKHVYLPKFATPPNPFSPPPPMTTPELPALPKADPSLVAAKTRPIPTLSQPPTVKVEKPVATGWVSKISAVSVWRGWKAEVKAQNPTVQTELSLEAVKVVHNDLSDADVEVVPIKSRPPVPTEPQRQLTGEETSWELVRLPASKEN